MQLSPAQLQAVTCRDPRIGVPAGPGSGKTRVLVERVAALLEEGVPSGRILCVTYTRAAAAEMRARLTAAVDERLCRHLTISTFHAWCARWVRDHASLTPLTRTFTVYDQDDHEDVARVAIRRLGAEVPVAHVVATEFRPPKSWSAAQRSACLAARAAVRDLLITINAATFDGLIGHARDLVEDGHGPDYEHILVDEVQDGDPLLLDLLQAIDPPHLFAVGDVDQSLYGFRGAKPRLFLRYLDDPETTTIPLSECYRCRPEIVQAANRLIAHNQDRWPEPLVPVREPGGQVQALVAADEQEQARITGAACLRSLDKHGLTVAVLCRSNREVRTIGEALSSAGVAPLEVVTRDTDPWSSEPGRDLLRLLRLVTNPGDDVALHGIAGPFLADAEWAGLEARAWKEEARLWDVLAEGAPAELGPALAAISKAREAETGPLDTGELLVPWLRDRYREQLRETKARRVEELLDALAALESSGAVRVETALDVVTFRSIQDRMPRTDPDEPHVVISTIHAAKGLEWPVVIMPGMAMGRFPLREASEEERRLAFVALTRAQEAAYLLTPQTIAGWRGGQRPVAPSPFVEEAIC